MGVSLSILSAAIKCHKLRLFTNNRNMFLRVWKFKTQALTDLVPGEMSASGHGEHLAVVLPAKKRQGTGPTHSGPQHLTTSPHDFHIWAS